MGISMLDTKHQEPIYSIYGFVRLADEIVDNVHAYSKRDLLNNLKKDYTDAIKNKISLNPILNSFQKTVNKYNIDLQLIEQFIKSMEMDLEKDLIYDKEKYDYYILGSAEVVGLMCLKVFVDGNELEYKKLSFFAKKLGSAFQKINFLRDVKADFHELGRTYFPDVNLKEFSDETKKNIELDIHKDFEESYQGVINLPKPIRGGVLLAYYYYQNLLQKIKKTSAKKILKKRIRISNFKKLILLIYCQIINKLNWL
tara:strand:+ start:523 stop:1287 length:765 start_codon:yes stop_codon:yes gene_type:complete